MIKASADLAKEDGKPEGSDETKYGPGILSIDTYKKDLDELVPHKERMAWTSLRKQLKETGIKNPTLMALMPQRHLSNSQMLQTVLNLVV